MTQLSENFHVNEFLRSDTAVRMGRPIVPTDVELNNLHLLTNQVMQPIRNAVREVSPNAVIIITSGLRPKWLNSAIGGSKNSQHMTGNAADFYVANTELSLYEVCQIIMQEHPLIPYDQLIYEGTWIHVSWSPDPRQKVLTAKFTRRLGFRKTTYYPGLVA